MNNSIILYWPNETIDKYIDDRVLEISAIEVFKN
jgi:hypothetical protein